MRAGWNLRCCLTGLCGVLVLAWAIPAAEPDDTITFLATSDCHYTSDKNPERLRRNQETLERMNTLPGTPWPDRLGGGPIGRPRGVVVLGDLIDDGDRPGETAIQWRHFESQFGLTGREGLLRYPVFEGWGNHDGPPAGKEKHGFSVQQRLRERTQTRLRQGLISRVSPNGLHYSWDWGRVHFLQANLYPADRQHPKIRYGLPWHDPQDALRFVRDDLASQVGPSGRPVIVMAHCGFDTDWWHLDDWTAFYRALEPYNVLAYFFGHTGTGVRTWKPTPADRPLDLVNTGQTEKGFFAVEIAARRMRLGYHIKMPGGDWEWKHLLERPIRNAP